MPEDVDVPDGEFEVDQDPDWFLDDLYSYKVFGEDDGDSG
jgi:hypothetical protein